MSGQSEISPGGEPRPPRGWWEDLRALLWRVCQKMWLWGRAAWKAWMTNVREPPPPRQCPRSDARPLTWAWWKLPPERRAATIMPSGAEWLGFLLILGGLYSMALLADSGYHRDRFDASNAYGAAANALERMESRKTPLLRPGEVIIAGVLLLIYGRLRQIRDVLMMTPAVGPRDQDSFRSDSEEAD